MCIPLAGEDETGRNSSNFDYWWGRILQKPTSPSSRPRPNLIHSESLSSGLALSGEDDYHQTPVMKWGRVIDLSGALIWYGLGVRSRLRDGPSKLSMGLVGLSFSQWFSSQPYSAQANLSLKKLIMHLHIQNLLGITRIKLNNWTFQYVHIYVQDSIT